MATHSTPRPNRNFQAARTELVRLLEEGKDLSAKALNDSPDSKTPLSIYERLEALAGDSKKNKIMRMGVMALAKSGKSTLLNALLGGEFLPVANTPETARVVYIRHSPSYPEGRLMEGASIQAEGAEAVNKALRSMNHGFRTSNGTSGAERLELHLPIAALTHPVPGIERPDEIKFELIDTPGPNEAGLAGLKERVHSLIHEADALVYLLDFTKLKTEDEADLFKVLGNLRPELLRKVSNTLFFVVNKFDCISHNSMNEEETRNYVHQILTSQLEVKNLAPWQIHLISAEHGFLARMAKLGRLNASQREDAARILFGHVTYAKNMFNVESEAQSLMNASRLEAFEQTVLTHVFNNRLELLLIAQLGKGINEVNKLKQHLAVKLMALNSDKMELKSKCDQLELELNNILNNSARIKDSMNGLIDKINSELKAEFNEFFADLNTTIDTKINDDKCSPLFKDDFERYEPDPRLKNLTKKIASTIKERVNGFTQHYLPTRGYEWNLLITDNLTPIIDDISRQIEAAVGNRLRINLVPIQLRLEPLDLDALSAQIQEEISRLRKLSITERTEQRTHKKKVKGMCCDSEEDVVEDYNIQIKKYKVNRDEYHEYWDQRIDEISETSAQVAFDRLDKEIRRNIQRAEKELKNYSSNYIQNLRQTLNSHSKGLDTLTQARASTQTNLESCNLLLHEFNDLEEYMEVHS